jgi:hypothetical protein
MMLVLLGKVSRQLGHCASKLSESFAERTRDR